MIVGFWKKYPSSVKNPNSCDSSREIQFLFMLLKVVFTCLRIIFNSKIKSPSVANGLAEYGWMLLVFLGSMLRMLHFLPRSCLYRDTRGKQTDILVVGNATFSFKTNINLKPDSHRIHSSDYTLQCHVCKARARSFNLIH